MRQYAVAIGDNDIDEYYRCERWPELGAKTRAEFIESKIGGMIGNAASVMAGYGLETYMMGNLGDDSYTQLILHDLKRHGVRTDFVQICKGVPNSKTHIMLAGGERTIFVLTNAKPPLEIDERKRNVLLHSAYVYTTIRDWKNIVGHETLMSELRDSGAGLAFDVEAGSFAGRDEDAPYMNEARLLFFNEFAFEKYGEGISREEAIGRLLTSDSKIVVVTLGARGCLVLTRQEQFHVEGFQVKPLDTTGAGDTFNASFVYGLTKRWDLRRTAEFASAAAARSVLAVGPKSGIAAEEEITEFMKTAKPGR